MENFNDVSKEKKAEFLKKLATGRYRIRHSLPPSGKLDFHLQPDGRSYRCEQDGKIYKAQDLIDLRDLYDPSTSIAVISTRAQAFGESLPAGIVLTPFSASEERLNAFLQPIDELLPCMSDDEINEEIRMLESMIANKEGSIPIEDWIKDNVKN